MNPLSFKEFDFAFNFTGTHSEEDTVRKLIHDIFLGNLIKAIFVEDLKRMLDSKNNHLFFHEFILPFDAKLLEEKIIGSERIVYGIYGNFNELDMRTIHEVDSVIESVMSHSIGVPIHSDNTDRFKIVGIIS